MLALLAAAVLTQAGCAIPTEYVTDLHADVWDGRLVIVTAHKAVGDQGVRTTIYRSGRNDLSRWELRGSYSGRPRAIMVRAGVLWAFFVEDGKAFARTYPLEGNSAAVSPPIEMPFGWIPQAACRDSDGAIWVAGVEDGHVVVARLGTESSASWQTEFPAGPPVSGEFGGPSDAARGAGASSAADDEGREWPPRLRACACGDLYVFWSGPPWGPGTAGSVMGARLGRPPAAREDGAAGPGDLPVRAVARTQTGGTGWTALPILALEHERLCAAPAAGGLAGIIARLPARPWSGGGHPHVHVEVGPSGAGWRQPVRLPRVGGKFLLGYESDMGWVSWGEGEILLRINTQRVEIVRHQDGKWELYRPRGASLLQMHLAEMQVLSLVAGALFLTVAGGVAFGTRLVQFRRGAPPAPALRPADGQPLAPILARTFAALFDLVLVSTPTVFLVGPPGEAANPLVPNLGWLALDGAILGALAAYGTFMEALFGMTLGKMAVGLRVERVDGGRLLPLQALVRNLLRPVDLFPPYTGALGLGLVALTRLRQRLGDFAAGTVVVSLDAAAGPRDEDA